MDRIKLRSIGFLDSLQSQHAAIFGSTAQGFLHVAMDSSLDVEVLPRQPPTVTTRKE